MKEIGTIAYVTKGVYSLDETYQPMNIVLYSESLWECTAETTGNTPPEYQYDENGNAASNDYWQLFFPGASVDGYVKNTDFATVEKAGIVKPDGKTIKLGEDGEIIGASSGFTGTKEEFEQALENGEIETGTIVNITDDYAEGGITVDSELSETSENPVQNKTVTIAVKNILSFMPKGAASHNGIFRGKDLTNIYTIDEMCDMISRGTFDDLYIGDYFDKTIHSTYTESEVVRNVFAVFNPYLNNGDTPFEQNHAGIVTKNCLTATHQMNSTNTTEGGFLGSDMWQTVLPVYAEAFQEALGGHLLTHRELLTNTVNADLYTNAGAGYKGACTNSEWVDATISFLSEIQVYGSNVFSSSFYDTGCDNLQLPLFALDPTEKVCGRGSNGEGSETERQWYWLKNVASSTNFAIVNNVGDSYASGSSRSGGVRLLFCLG